jgi:hypothetical protein
MINLTVVAGSVMNITVNITNHNRVITNNRLLFIISHRRHHHLWSIINSHNRVITNNRLLFILNRHNTKAIAYVYPGNARRWLL